MVGEDRPETPLRHLAQGLRDAGWEVGQIDTGRYGLQSRDLRARIAARLTGKLLSGVLGRDTEARLRRDAPDLVIFVKTMPLSPQQVAAARAAGTRIAIWYPDVSFDHQGVPADWLDRIDLFITTKSYHVDHVRARRPDLPVAFVHHGYCDGVHHPVAIEQPPYDVVYVGNPSPAKLGVMTALHDARPQLRILVSGNGWPESTGWVRTEALVAEQMARALASARIALGVHYGSHGSEGWADLVSARTFEIPACGAFMLHPDNAEVRTLFEPEREIGVFADLADLPRQVDRWLADDAGRRAAAHRAMTRARPAYSYRARGGEIAQFLEANGVGTQR